MRQYLILETGKANESRERMHLGQEGDSAESTSVLYLANYDLIQLLKRGLCHRPYMRLTAERAKQNLEGEKKHDSDS